MEKRNCWVDYAKALGIVLVVYGHVLRGLHSAGIDMPERFYWLSDSIVYSFHMPLFFFLAGLFFYQSFAERRARRLIFSKLDTVLYPFVLWSIMQGLIEAFLADYTNGTVTYADVFSLLWAPRAQFWFLYALMACFVLAAVVFTLCSRRSAILVAVVAALLYLNPSALPSGLLSGYIADNFVFFALGIVFSNHADMSRPVPGWLALVMAGLFIAGQYVFHGLLELSYTERGTASLALALMSIAAVVAVCSCAAQRHIRAIAYVGAASMAIYLMHILAGSGVRVGLRLAGVESFVLHSLLGVTMGVAAPLAAFAMINRLKVPYVFSAPISRWLAQSLGRTVRRAVR